MKKHNAEEAKNLLVILSGRTTLVYAQVSTLLPGEALEITRQDWKSKHPPYAVVNRVAKKTGCLFEKGRLPDGSGWVVKRIS